MIKPNQDTVRLLRARARIREAHWELRDLATSTPSVVRAVNGGESFITLRAETLKALQLAEDNIVAELERMGLPGGVEPRVEVHPVCGGKFVETKTPESLQGPWTCDKCGLVTPTVDRRHWPEPVSKTEPPR